MIEGAPMERDDLGKLDMPYELNYKLTVQSRARRLDGVRNFQSDRRLKTSTAVKGLGGHGRTEL